jgi:hypothetical protein
VLGGWPWRLGLGLVAVAGLRALRGQDTKMRALAVFAAAWGASALLFPLVFGEPHSEYLIPGFVGVTLLAVPGLASSTRAWRATAQLGLALLVLSGLVDNARLVRPAAWSTLSGYDGLTFARTLGVDALDADEVPYFADLAGRGDRWVGIATSGRPGCGQPLRHTTGALPQPGASRCPTWSRGQLAERIRRITPDERLPNPPELLSIGRGAWIVCDRDVEQVRAAVEGLPARAAEQIVRGAMAEQVQTGVGRAAREVDRVRGRSPP